MIRDAVFEVIAHEQKCSLEDFTLESRLEDLGIDSLKAITILYQLEERFELEIPNELIESVETVGDIVTGIDQLRRKSGAECQDV